MESPSVPRKGPQRCLAQELQACGMHWTAHIHTGRCKVITNNNNNTWYGEILQGHHQFSSYRNVLGYFLNLYFSFEKQHYHQTRRSLMVFQALYQTPVQCEWVWRGLMVLDVRKLSEASVSVWDIPLSYSVRDHFITAPAARYASRLRAPSLAARLVWLV